jgi:hypothetical protein
MSTKGTFYCNINGHISSRHCLFLILVVKGVLSRVEDLDPFFEKLDPDQFFGKLDPDPH